MRWDVAELKNTNFGPVLFDEVFEGNGRRNSNIDVHIMTAGEFKQSRRVVRLLGDGE